MVHAPDPPRHGARRVISPGLAAMLADARRARGLSLRTAARLAGCSAGTIVHLEKARRAPSAILAEGLISAYRLDADRADRLLAEVVHDAGRCSPYKDGPGHPW